MKTLHPFIGLYFKFPKNYSPEKKTPLISNLKKICSGYIKLYPKDKSNRRSASTHNKHNKKKEFSYEYRRNLPNMINVMGKKRGIHLEIIPCGEEVTVRAVDSKGKVIGMDRTLGLKEQVLSHPGFFNDPNNLSWKVNRVFKGIFQAVMDGYR